MAKTNATQLNGTISELKHSVDHSKNEFQEAARHARAAGVTVMEDVKRIPRRAMNLVEEQTQKTPWSMLAGASASAMVIGFLIGRRFR